MPILQWIKEYTFDLDIADKALSTHECKWLDTTMRSAEGRGTVYGNQAIRKIVEFSDTKHIVFRTSQYPSKATFQEYLQYLHRRAQA